MAAAALPEGRGRDRRPDLRRARALLAPRRAPGARRFRFGGGAGRARPGRGRGQPQQPGRAAVRVRSVARAGANPRPARGAFGRGRILHRCGGGRQRRGVRRPAGIGRIALVRKILRACRTPPRLRPRPRAARPRASAGIGSLGRLRVGGGNRDRRARRPALAGARAAPARRRRETPARPARLAWTRHRRRDGFVRVDRTSRGVETLGTPRTARDPGPQVRGTPAPAPLRPAGEGAGLAEARPRARGVSSAAGKEETDVGGEVEWPTTDANARW